MRDDPPEVPEHVARSVETIGELYGREEHRVDRHQRAIEALTVALGRPAMLYAVLALVLAWSVGNALAPRLGVRPLDPAPFFWLQGAVSLLGLLVTAMVLVRQNRLGRLAQRRAHLDLQVNLLAEQKIAKLIALVEELRRDLPGVQNRRDTEAEAMAAAADPRAVLQALDATLGAVIAQPPRESGAPASRLSRPHD